jgi:hypothetical protein
MLAGHNRGDRNMATGRRQSKPAGAAKGGGGTHEANGNGVTVSDPTHRLHQAMLDLATKQLDKPGLASLLRTLAMRR